MADSSLVYIGAFLWVVAITMLVVEERAVRARRRWCATAARAEGEVARIGRRGYHSRNEPTSSVRFVTVPVVRFRAANGAEYEFDAPGVPKKVGEKVQVAYDAKLPSTAQVVGAARQVGCAVVLGAIGIVLIGFGVFQ